ncbi:MAG: hypothetical protein IJ150_11840, partial [Bacteroidales bacterium]|nr:hypothetical protein [Bacteroidales bacterium]
LSDEEKNALPTKEEWEALINNCYWLWVNSDGKTGYYVFKAKADSDKGKKSYDNPALEGEYDATIDDCIFLPVLSKKTVGCYWTGTVNGTKYYYLNFSNSGLSFQSNHSSSSYLFLTVNRVDD